MERGRERRHLAFELRLPQLALPPHFAVVDQCRAGEAAMCKYLIREVQFDALEPARVWHQDRAHRLPSRTVGEKPQERPPRSPEFVCATPNM